MFLESLNIVPFVKSVPVFVVFYCAMRVSGFLSLLFFCDAYEFFTNFRIKELPIKLFPYNFVRPHKSFETRIIVVLYWKGFFLIRDIEVLSYFLGVTMAESKGMRWVMVYITPGRRWKWIFYKSYVFYNRSRTNLE